MNNIAMYGFRLHRSLVSSGIPSFERMIVATAQTFPVNGGAATPNLSPGDLVRRTTTGGAITCDGSEGAGGALAPYGVVMGIGPQWNATKNVMEYADTLGSGIAWGTNLERQSTIFVIPANWAEWEVDVDENTTATTKAAYQDMIGENADHILTGASGETTIKPLLDISSNATTNTLIWQIIGISDTGANRDFSGTRVKLIVKPNIWQDTSTTGT
jgi:hypothetical protein